MVNNSSGPRIEPAPCENERIAFLGQIQPHGFLLEVSPDWNVVRCSENLGNYLPTEVGQASGRPLHELIGRRALHDIRGELQVIGMKSGVRHLFDVPVGAEGIDTQLFDLSVSRTSESIIIECEPSAASGDDASGRMVSLLNQLRDASDIDRFCDVLAAQTRALCGYDRAMVYKFHEDLSGEVVAERSRGGMDSFLGLRYPASDIPAQARALYLVNPLRVVANVQAQNAFLVPLLDYKGDMLDLSMASLRAVSPVHIEYLNNMGVCSSMSVSLIVDGKLWGLLVCHHNSPRYLAAKLRMALEFYGQMASSIIENFVRRAQERGRAVSRDTHMRMLSMVSPNAVGEDNLFAMLSDLRTSLNASGMATYVDGLVRRVGSTPGLPAMMRLVKFLNGAAISEVFTTHCLAQTCPEAVADCPGVAGLLAVPISRSPRDFVLFFRDELVAEVKWAGKPDKVVRADAGVLRYSPRASFALWKERVHEQSAQWSDADRDKGESLRVSLLEVMLRMTDTAEKMRKQSNDQQDTLIAELNHRVRNILNLIVGLVRQCGNSATSVTQFTEDISSRIHALARAHDQLTSSGWRPKSLSDMVRIEAAAYLGDNAASVIIIGSDWAIEPEAFATLALVFHELITNSAKYGAFKHEGGHARLLLERGDTGDLSVQWSEHGGSIVVQPTRRGFGSTIIERAIPHELGGKAAVEFAPDGLIARFEIPARYISSNDDAPATSYPIIAHAPSPLLPPPIGNILLVEDNLLIAIETESTLLSMGAESVQVVSTVAAALETLRQFTPDFAVLDYNLGRETSLPIAEHLSEQNIPFMFVTGYGDTAIIDQRFRGRPVVSKPYDASALILHIALGAKRT
jgi:light-regulated signal transduction histidine kinase (bacteriophytochrome)/CheY-like chemotaxis protein